jgi:hypothetical protein
VRKKAALVGGAIAGAVGAVLLRRRSAPEPAPAAPGPDPRAEELRQKLAEAREAAEHEDEFEAAGMGGETIVEPDVDEARRRVHEAGRAKAEDIRRSGEGEDAA